VLVTQDLGIVANYCDRVYLLHAGQSVEEAPTEDFFKRPAHPASVGLLMAQRGMKVEELKLSGFPIDGRRLPTGCWLHPRCPFISDEAGCKTNHPDFFEVSQSHVSRCFRHEHVQETLASLMSREASVEVAPSTSPGAEE